LTPIPKHETFVLVMWLLLCEGGYMRNFENIW